jgi:D-3-phosphoglycerate dehydrogenase
LFLQSANSHDFPWLWRVNFGYYSFCCMIAMPLLLVCGGISDRLASQLEEICKVEYWKGDPIIDSPSIDNVDFLVLRSPFCLTSQAAESAHKLRLVIRAGSGMEGLPLDLLIARGISVQRLNLASASVAELAFALLLSVARSVPAMDIATKSGLWLKHQAEGMELEGKRMLVLGFGKIGQKVVRIAAGFRMVVDVVDSSPWKPEKQLQLKSLDVQCVDLDLGVARADVVVLCCSLTPTSRNLIDRSAVEKMQPHAIIINVSRAGVMSEDAINLILQTKRLAGLGIDVHRDEPNCNLPLSDSLVATPHIGAQTKEARNRIENELFRLISSHVSAHS